MAKSSQTDSRRMYSWWWDSHISPKNSKWLQENLTDMDAKIKAMIKLLEEDADSFARRAEMYYKKRPELMKLVEEFYRAYRALAERYDHATGVIRHAHRTMAEAFPNQVPLMFADDSPASSVSGTDPRTPEVAIPLHVLCEDDDIRNVALGISSSNSHAVKQNGECTDESDSITRSKGFNHFSALYGPFEQVRKGLNFDEAEVEKEQNMQSRIKDKRMSNPDQVNESEDILLLKEALAKLEAEKEAGLVQYQQSLGKLSQLESEVCQTQEDFRVLNDHATKAENEVVVLKKALTKSETEKDSKLQGYEQCLDRIANLQNIISTAEEDAQKLNERATNVEIEAQSLKGELNKLSIEKDAALNQYMESLEMISNLENKLRLTDENARRLKERAEKAESEVEILKQTVSKLTEEKEAASLRYQQCLQTISSLEKKLTSAQEEAKCLNVKIDSGVSKLKGAEEQCLLLERSNQSLHSELESLMLKMGTQSQELTEKQKELGRLWACIQEERLRFLEAEIAFQTLQQLHTQTKEELRSLASELHNRAQLLKVAENHNQSLLDEVLKVKEENKLLDQLNASSALSIKDLQNEISSLKESKGKLEEEVELRLDQRNALQQEIYCLKEELKDLNKKHLSVLDQVHAVGLNPESLGSSVEELQDENSNLKETCHRESSDKAALLEKLEILDQLLEKNSILETTLSDLSAELEAFKQKIEALEQSCQSLSKEKSTLLDEKATLMAQLQETNKNLVKLSENNTVLVNSLSDTHYQLEALKAKSKIIEDSYQLLVNETARLISEKDGLNSQLEITRTRLEDLGKIYGELEGRCITLEKEKASTLLKVEELQMSLETERQELASYVQMSKTHFSGIEAEMCLLQEECQWRKRELDQVLHNAIDNEIEISVLRITAKELEENNCSLLIKNQKLLVESSLSEKKMSQLENNNYEQKVEIKSLSNEASILRAGTWQLLKILDIAEDHACKDRTEQDQICVNQLLSELQNMKVSLSKAEEENLKWAVEMAVLVGWIKQQRLEAQTLEVEKDNIEHEFKIRTKQFLMLQSEVLTLLDLNEELRSKLRDEDCNKEALVTQIEDLNRKLMEMQGTCQVLQGEKFKISEEKRSLMDNILQLDEKNHVLEEENYVLCGKVLALENLSLIFRRCADDKFMLLRELGDDLNKLHAMNAVLMGKLSLTEGRLEESKVENLHHKERLQKTEDELKEVATVNDQLSNEIENGKNQLHQMVLELRESERKISLIEKEKLELDKSVENMTIEYNEVKMVRDCQENQILKLTADNDHLSRENNRLQEASDTLEVELQELHGQHDKRKIQEQNFDFELQKKINEINKLETQAASIFGQLQYSMVSLLLYEQKFNEIHEACHGYIDQNEGLKTQLAAYGPEILSLKECISSLENHTNTHIKLQNPENEELQGAQITNDPCRSLLNEDKKALMQGTVSDLCDLRARLQMIEKAAVEAKELMLQENMDLHTKLDASTRKLELLQSESVQYKRNLKPTSEITEADNAILTKDIMLDQISDGSAYGFNKRREPVDTDNQTVELGEAADQDGAIGKSKKISPSTGNNTDVHRVESLNKPKGEYQTSDELVEELSIDKLDISKRFTEPLQEGNKRKVLERLDSDVQKLANLQIVVQDLKRKLDITEKGKLGKAVVEGEPLNRQLEEADVNIKKLFDLNGRLTKSIEGNSFSDLKFSFDLEGDGSTRRSSVSEQAGRMSEKIGRLQLEVQKLQYILLKLDDEKKGKTQLLETRRRTLLRDYLYGGGRTGQRRKRVPFCSCIQPSTIED